MTLPYRELLVAGLLTCGFTHAWANPQGGQVASGAASIQTAPGTVTVNQQSNTSIINWQSFSIGAGELTKFVQPSATSASLNRVLGGQTSLINGTLSANGQVYLINGNGILVGPGGVINTSSFTGSTRDITDADFLQGNLHFIGSNTAGVQNFGTINALGGQAILIGKTVDNEGTITAPVGTVGLAAGDDVLINQAGTEHVFVNPTATATSATSQVGVKNGGTISGAAAELKAANGNIYAMAIQNKGTIRATTVQHQGGRIWLTSDSGSVVNSGTLDASATAVKGKGGTILLKSTNGTAVHSGSILARGGQGGAGGNAEVSGAKVQFSGTVDLQAPGGTTGDLLLDPASLEVVTGGVGFIMGGQNDGSSSTIDPAAVVAALMEADVTLNADSNITITNAISWSTNVTTTLTLSTNNPGSTLNINAPILGGMNGNLTINMKGATDVITPSSLGMIGVNVFTLQSGSWQQINPVLPLFEAGVDFELQGTSTFLRATGGDGSTGNPYQISDVYGLQGLASPSNSLLGANAVLANDIDANLSGGWDGEVGFVPIGTQANPYTGTFNGAGHIIDGLASNGSINRTSYMGLFGATSASATIENVGLTNDVVSGDTFVGGLVGDNLGTVQNSYNSGVVAGVNGNGKLGGLVGENDGLIQSSYSSVTVNPTDEAANSINVGGLVGYNIGTIQNSFSTSAITVVPNFNASNVGGLVGVNLTSGIIENSFSTGSITAGDANINAGGLVGFNQGTVKLAYSTGAVSGGTQVGGLVGQNGGSIQTTYSTGAVTGISYLGGFVGENNVAGTVLNSYWNADANASLTTSGINAGTITNVNGETLAALQTQATFLPARTAAGDWNFTPGTGDWIMVDGLTTPFLQTLSTTISGQSFSDNGITPTPGDFVYIVSQGSFIVSTTSGTAGAYSFLVSADQATSGVLVVDDSATTANTFYTSGLPLAPAVSGIDLWGGTVRFVGTGLASNTKLVKTAGNDEGALFTSAVDPYTNGYDLHIISPYNVDIESPLYLDGDITVPSGSLTTTALGSLTAFEPVTLTTTNGDISLAGPVIVTADLSLSTNNNINLTNTISGPGELDLNATTINAQGDVHIGNFVLVEGNWEQLVNVSGNGGNITGSLPAFTAENLELQDGTSFLRAIGGSGTTTSPYLITDVYGLEGIGSTGMLAQNFALANNLDASAAMVWGDATGFFPIGSSDLGFSGIFDGQNFAIAGLYMNVPGNSLGIGLFGYNSGTVKNVALTNVNITAENSVGALAGINYGTVQGSSAFGLITITGGGSQAGGLVGTNNGLVTTSASFVSITGYQQTGGLVGENSTGATISNSYNLGTVTVGDAGDTAGGLVGENDGTVESSYSAGLVMGNGAPAVGGLIGDNTSTVTNSYWATDLSNQPTSAGGVGLLASALSDYNTFQLLGVVGTGVGQWDFTLGTGAWGVNAFSSVGPINGGLPILQTMVPIAAQVAANNQTVVYGGTPDTTTAYTVVQGSIATALPGGPTLTIVGTNTDVESSNVIQITGLPTAPNVVEYINGTEQFSPATLTVVSATPVTKVYDGTTTASLTAANYTLNGFVGSDDATLTTTGGTYDSKDVTATTATFGGLALSFSSGLSQNYTLSSNSVALPGSITPAPLTVNGAFATDKTYDGTPTATLLAFGTLQGVIGTDNVTLDTTAATANFPGKNVGTNLAVTVAGYALGGTAAADYTVSQPTGLMASISALALTVTGATANSKTYDTTSTASLSSLGTLAGVVSGDNVTIDASDYVADFPSKNVGNNLAVTVFGLGLAGADAGNYTLSQPTGLTANITAAALSITGAAANNKIYDATPSATLSSFGTLQGVIGTDNVTLDTTAYAANFPSKNVGNNLAVTVGGYALGGADAGNYSVTQPTGLTANISALGLTITGAAASSKIYNATATATLSNFGTLNGVAQGDNVTLDTTVYTANFPSKNVGNNLAVTVGGYALAGTDAGNYTVTQPSGLTANISAATLTIVGAVASSKIYDTTATDTLANVGTLSGEFSTDNVTLNTASYTASFPGKNVGNNLSVIVTGYTVGGTDASNYTFSQPTGLTANITPAPLTIVGAAAGSKTYDATPTATLTSLGGLNGVLGTDNVTLNTAASSATFPSKNVGTNLPVTATGYAIGGTDVGNYALSQPTSLTANITPATLTITGTTAGNKTYDGTTTATLTNAGTLGGVIGSDNVTVNTAASTANFSSQNVGNNLPVTVSTVALAGTDAGNYTVAQPSGVAANITPATLTITANNAVEYYNSSNAPYSGGNGVTYHGFVNGESAAVLGGTVAYGGSSQGAVAIGNYVIAPSGLTSSNYAINYANGALDILPLVVPVTIPPQSLALIASVIASAANQSMVGTADLGLPPPNLGIDIVYLDDLSPDAGAINDGSQISSNIAYGSSTSAAAALFRLVPAGTRTNIIINGIVDWEQAPQQFLDLFAGIFSAEVQNNLLRASQGLYPLYGTSGGAAVPGASAPFTLLTHDGGIVVIANGGVGSGGTPPSLLQEFEAIFNDNTQNNLLLASQGGYSAGGAVSGAPAPFILLTPNGGIVVISNGAVAPGATPPSLLQEFENIFNDNTQDQMHNAASGH